MKKRIISFWLVIALVFNVIGTPLGIKSNGVTKANAASTSEAISTWDGNTMEKVYEEEGYTIVFSVTGYWSNGFNASVSIENNGCNVIENWYLNMSMFNGIGNIYDAEVFDQANDAYIIKSKSYNQDIAVGKSVSFGFTGIGDFIGFPEECKLLGDSFEINDEYYNVECMIVSEWDSGFIGYITINNNTTSPIEDWKLSFYLNAEITNLWHGQIVEQEEGQYIVKNAGYNYVVPANSSVSFGFQATKESGDERPVCFNDIALSEITIDENLYIKIGADTSNFEKHEYGEYTLYTVDKKLDSLTGTLTGSHEIMKFSYSVEDINRKEVFADTIVIDKNWEASGIGLVVGANMVTISAVSYAGNTYNYEIVLLNTNIDNMDLANVDTADNDLDGINNYVETIYETNPELSDTDGDGLSDYEEIYVVGTSPLMADTNSNGVWDCDEDFDGDGLNSLEELVNGTGLFYSDTDNDGLMDGDEIKVYYTNPLVADTDCDKLEDGQDVELGWNPANPDTDGNGVLDGDEVLSQTFSLTVDETEKAGVTKVEVTLDCSGHIDDVVNIQNTYNLDMRSSEVAGLIGVPVDITVLTEFETADITFTYNEDALGETDEANIGIIWYDEENDNYIVLNDAALDTEKNTITYTTDHFSTYLLVDKTIWIDTMRKNLYYRSTEAEVYYDMALVVDVSGSMSGDYISKAKMALNSLVDGKMYEDKVGIVKFNSTALVVQALTNDPTQLKSRINSLTASGGTNAHGGIILGVDMLAKSTSGNEKIMVLVCDGDISYNQSLVDMANKYGITIYCINVVNGSSSAMERIAINTGGQYFYATTSDEIEEIFSELKGETLEHVDITDTDGDGLYDVYEAYGFRLSNGKVVYTNPYKTDSDGDGVSDFDEMGGLPVRETYVIDGIEFTSVLNHSNTYDVLPDSFIYVDGTENKDGTRNFEKMDYVPYSNQYIYDNYEKEITITYTNPVFDGETRFVSGFARVYKSFHDKLEDVDFKNLLHYTTICTLAVGGASLANNQAAECLYTFIVGNGGDYEGWCDDTTRKYLYARYIVEDGIFNINSAHTYFINNMFTAIEVAESVLNEYNTEVYLALSPEVAWTGCLYHETINPLDICQSIDSLLNLPAFGIYNKADAGITMYCKYDPVNELYTMEFKYYIIDFYNFNFYSELDEMEALGIARSYELYGVVSDTISWTKDESAIWTLSYRR